MLKSWLYQNKLVIDQADDNMGNYDNYVKYRNKKMWYDFTAFHCRLNDMEIMQFINYHRIKLEKM